MESIPPLFEEEDDFYAPSTSAEAEGNSSFSLPGHQSPPLPGSPGSSSRPLSGSPLDSSQTLSTPPSTNPPGPAQSLSIPTSSTPSSLPLVPSLIPPTDSFACRRNEIIPVKEKKRPCKPSPPRNKRPNSWTASSLKAVTVLASATNSFQGSTSRACGTRQTNWRGTLWTWW